MKCFFSDGGEGMEKGKEQGEKGEGAYGNGDKQADTKLEICTFNRVGED